MFLKLILNTPTIWVIFIKKIEEYNPNKNLEILVVFDYMIADMLMLSNIKINPIVTESFNRGRKLSISIAFITQYLLFCCAKKY